MRRTALLIVLATSGVAMADGPVNSGGSAASFAGSEASVLWDQTGSVKSGVIDQKFADFPTADTYMVDDFTTGGATWDLTGITGVYYGGNGNWAGLTSARISLFAKGGSMPLATDIPGLASAPVIVTPISGGFLVSADLSGVAACQGITGDFWIGMTPETTFGVDGQQFHGVLTDDQYGDNYAVRNPGEFFAKGPDWMGGDTFVAPGNEGDMWFQLSGNVVPTPGAAALLGLGGLVIGRRRR